MPSRSNAWTMGSACSATVMVTEKNAEAVITPPAANPPLTMFSAVASQPVLAVLPATSRLLDQDGGALLSTVRATASCCCSLARPGATATTRPENPAAVASASSMSFARRPSVPSSHQALQLGLPQAGGAAGSYSVSRTGSYGQPGMGLGGAQGVVEPGRVAIDVRAHPVRIIGPVGGQDPGDRGG